MGQFAPYKNQIDPANFRWGSAYLQGRAMRVAFDQEKAKDARAQEMHDLNMLLGMKTLNEKPQGTYKQATAAQDAQGNPAMIQVDSSGNVRDTGYDPVPRPPPSTTVNANISTGSKEGQKFAATQFDTMSTEANQSATSVHNIDAGISQLDSGVIAGFAGNIKLGIAKALNSVGLFPGDSVQNTEEYLSITAKQVAQIIKQFGAGTGLSDADRDYAEKAAGGEITLTAAGMKRILEMNRKIEMFKIKQYNDRLSSWQSSDQQGRKDISQWFDPVTMPSSKSGLTYDLETGKIK